MTLGDASGWLNLLVAIVGTYFVYQTYLKTASPKDDPAPTEATPVRSEPDQKTMFRRQIWVLVALVVLSWGTTRFQFAERHFSTPELAEMPLKAENARIDVTRWEPVINAQKQFFTNVHTTNNGHSDALKNGFQGYALTGGVPDTDLADAFFIVLKRKVAASRTETTIHPGQPDQWLSIPNIPPFMQLDDTSIQNYRDGKLPIIIFLVLVYGDSSLPANKNIYGEKCVIIIQDVVHFCATHNREFIAD